MRRVVLWVLGLTAVGGALAAVNARHESRPIEVDWQLFRPQAPRVIVAHPTRGPIARMIAAQGVVEPLHQVAVVAKVGGRVAEVLVAEGTSVRAGDPLLRLETGGFRARVDAAQARFDTAAKNLGIAEAHLRNIEKDPAGATAPALPATPASVNPAANPALAGLARLRAGAAAAPGPAVAAPVPPPGPTRLGAARDSVDGWLRERKEAETARDAARTELERATLRAPIAGVVEDLAMAAGDDVFARPTITSLARPGRLAPAGLPGGLMGGTPVEAATGPEAGIDPDRPLCTILDPDELRVRAWIDEADVGLIRAEQPAQVFLPDEPTTPVAGRISRVAPRGRPNGEVVAYAAIADARHRARVGMRVNVEVEVSRLVDPLGVPVQAVLHRKRRDLPEAGVGSARAGSEADRSGRDSGYVRVVFVLEGNRARLRPIETGLSDERRVEITSGLTSEDRVVVGPFRALDALDEGMVVAVDAPRDEASGTHRPTPRADDGPPAGWGAPR